MEDVGELSSRLAPHMTCSIMSHSTDKPELDFGALDCHFQKEIRNVFIQ